MTGDVPLTLDFGYQDRPEPQWIYEAVREDGYGLGAKHGMPIFGLTLRLHSSPDPEMYPKHCPDLLEEELSVGGPDIPIVVPQGGLVEGCLYRCEMYDMSTDWETGYLDDYKLRDAPTGLTVTTSWFTLMSLAHAVGIAKRSGDPEAIAQAEADLKDYEKLVLESDRTILPFTTGDLHGGRA